MTLDARRPGRRLVLAGACAALGLSAGGASVRGRGSAFPALEGWTEDRHDEALALWIDANGTEAARRLDAPSPGDGPEMARRWWETRFALATVVDASSGLLTGYYEPVLDASPAPDSRFAWPLLTLPPELARGEPLPDRAAIMDGALSGRGLELYWLDDPVSLFFLQVQGSGRLRLPDGRLVRVGYAGRNGHDYVSVGRLLVAEGFLPARGVTAAQVQDWLRADPARGMAIMARNPSYVFFREITGLPETSGPIGALGRPFVAGRSLAVDPSYHPLGSPVWVAAEGLVPRLMIAMDTGSAIRGPQRGDIFFGTGGAAGEAAGALAARGGLLRLVERGPRG